MNKIPVIKLVEAKQKAEGWFEGSLSYQNNNPCNLRVDGDKGRQKGFGKFSTYDLGAKRCIQSIRWYADRGATVQGLVYGFSPLSDNPATAVKNHLDIVTRATGTKKTDKLHDVFDFSDVMVASVDLPYISLFPPEEKTEKWGGQCAVYASQLTGIKGKLGISFESKITKDLQKEPKSGAIGIVDTGTIYGHAFAVADKVNDQIYKISESNKYGDELITNYIIQKKGGHWYWTSDKNKKIKIHGFYY